MSKEALIEAAWPGLAIEDGNLTVQIAALRRVLGEEANGASWIETLPRRGYRFIAPVERPEVEPLRKQLPPSHSLRWLAFAIAARSDDDEARS